MLRLANTPFLAYTVSQAEDAGQHPTRSQAQPPKSKSSLPVSPLHPIVVMDMARYKLIV
jgi:hypothetical protein